MSKFNKFVKELNKEVDNITIPDRIKEVKDSFNKNEVKEDIISINTLDKPKRIFNLKLVLGFTCIILLLISSIFIFKNDNPVINPNIKVPVIAKNIDDAYAFEVMAACNYLYTDSNIMTKRRMKKNTNELNEVCEKINKHYLTINQMLSKDKLEYKIFKNDNLDEYEYKMLINPIFNSYFDLEYILYFNKTLVKNKDVDDEEIYNINGIIIIDNYNYKVIGETIIEDDETETEIKVYTGENDYFIIEQEKEIDEEEYVYKSYNNGKLIKEFAISYEIDKNEIEIELEIKTNNSLEKVEAKFKNGYILLEVEFDDYEGEVKVIENENTITYNFIKEKIEINKKIIK